MSNAVKQPWIEAGYISFAKEGPKGLKVERIAKAVNKSKSSFYHLFSDLEVFTELLLEYHLNKAKELAERAKLVNSIEPDMIVLLLEYKIDLLFNRQLRVHRNNQTFVDCFKKANALVEDRVMTLWSEALGLKKNVYLGRIIMDLAMDNFYLRMTEETLNYEWLLSYLGDVKTMVKEIVKSKILPN